MPTTTQRLEVWKGLRKKTSGGLTKSMLTRNKRGKIGSKKKADQAAAQNNLGSFLREAGKKVAASEMLRKKGSKKQPKAAPKKSAPKPKAAPKKSAPKPKAAPKKQPAKAVPPKKAAPKLSGSSASKKAVKQKKRRRARPEINPLTQQPYDKRNPTGYVASGNVSLDNVQLKKRSLDPHAFEEMTPTAW